VWYFDENVTREDMMSTSSGVGRQVNHIKREGEKAADAATTSPVVETMTRLGYVARGLVYGMIGFLALQVASGKGGTVPDPQGAIAALGQTPLGKSLLYLVLIGLVGYSLWGIIRAVFDPLHKGTSLKGLAQRVGFLISGISYGLLIPPTYGLITASPAAARNGTQTAQTQQATASILSQPGGQWLVAIIGGILLLLGLSYIVQGLHRSFPQQFTSYRLTANQRKWIDRLGRFGTAARGVVFVLIGTFLFQAAYQHDPSRAKGIDGALLALLQQPYGPWLLAIVAAGLVAFAFYSAISGLWLRLKR
jgi:hypothetical protein